MPLTQTVCKNANSLKPAVRAFSLVPFWFGPPMECYQHSASSEKKDLFQVIFKERELDPETVRWKVSLHLKFIFQHVVILCSQDQTSESQNDINYLLKTRDHDYMMIKDCFVPCMNFVCSYKTFWRPLHVYEDCLHSWFNAATFEFFHRVSPPVSLWSLDYTARLYVYRTL